MNNSCPNCGTVYNITPQLIGKSTTCKKCGASLVIDASGLQLAGGPRPGSQFDFQPVPRGPSWFGEFLSFRKMISPFIVKYILFYIGVVWCVYNGIRGIIDGFRAVSHSIPGAWNYVLVSFGVLILGPVFVRFSCEVMLVIFQFVEAHCQMNDSLKDIKKDLKK